MKLDLRNLSKRDKFEREMSRLARNAQSKRIRMMMNMTNLTKAAAIEALAEELGVSKVYAGTVYTTVMDLISNTLEEGYDVLLPGVGRIHTADVAARVYPVPGTTETISKAAGKKYKLTSKTKYSTAV